MVPGTADGHFLKKFGKVYFMIFRLLLWFSCESLLLFDHMVLDWTKFIMFTTEQLIWISSQLDIKSDLELESLGKVPQNNILIKVRSHPIRSLSAFQGIKMIPMGWSYFWRSAAGSQPLIRMNYPTLAKTHFHYTLTTLRLFIMSSRVSALMCTRWLWSFRHWFRVIKIGKFFEFGFFGITLIIREGYIVWVLRKYM